MLEQFQLVGAGEIAFAVLIVAIGFIFLWVAVSIPVWVAAKIMTLGKARFTRAMLVTAVGPAIYAAVFFFSNFVLSITLGERFLFALLSFVLAFIAWIGVFKMGFQTGWIRAFGIAFLAAVVFVIIGVILTLGLQAVVPDVPQITPFPSF